MNKLEKIFRLIINFGDSEKRIPQVGKLLQSLHARFQHILQVIREIGAETGIKEAASALKFYDTTVQAAEKSKRKYAETTADENARNQEAQKYIGQLKAEYGNLIFTKEELAALTKNYIDLQRAETGSAEELAAKLNLLSLSWRKVGAEKQNSAQGKQVTAELKQLHGELRQTTIAAGENTRSMSRFAAVIALVSDYLKLQTVLSQLATLHARASALATALHTASLSGNTVALIRNAIAMQGASAVTKAYAVVKLLFAGNVKAATVAVRVFTAALAKNPLGIFAVALASVVSYFVFFRKNADAAADAQKRFNDENDRFNKTQDEKRQRTEALIRIIQDETETELAKVRAYGELERLSPALTAKYTQEQIATLALADSARLLNEQRDKENYDNLVAKVEKYTATLKKLREEHGKMVFSKYSNTYQPVDNSKQIEKEENDLANYKKALQEVVDARAKVAEKLVPIKTRIIEAEADVERTKEEFDNAVKAYNDVRDKWVQEHGTERTIPFYFKFDKIEAETQYTEAQKKLNGLKKEDKSASDPKDKGEWSLSKDKAHNDALLRLKEQLHKGEIASEEAYNKQALELEIDTLGKRIALNKDGNQVLVKLRNELADKRYQLQKTEKKEAEAAAADEQARAALTLKYENDHIDAGVAALKEGVDQRVRLNDQATKKSLEAAEQSYKAEIKSLEDKQKAYKADSAEYMAIEANKAELFFAYDQKCTDIRDAGADERVNILREATAEELTEYAKLPGKAAEAERLITENKRLEVEKRLALAKEETNQSIGRAQNQYGTNENLADATIGKSGRKRNVARLQNEIQLHKDQAQAYQRELDAILAGGDNAIEEHKTRYDELIQLIGKEQEAAMNLGKGKTAGGKRKSIWALLTEMSDEDINQLKQQALDLASQIGDAMIQAQQQASQRRLNNEKKAIEAQYKVESKLLDDRRDKGLISEKTYQKQMEKLEAEKAKKEEEAERAAFEREKRLNIMQVLMNTALGIAKAIAQSPITFGLPWAAFVAAQGAIQIASISSQKFAQGGIIPIGDKTGVVKGGSHAQGGNILSIDGRPIGEIEHDELIAIVNKHDTRRIGALSAANSVHGRKFADGGLLFPNGVMTSRVAPPVSLSRLDAQLRVQEAQRHDAVLLRQDAAIQVLADNIRATNDRIDRIKVLVVAQEVSDMQDGIKKIQVKSSW